MTRDRHCVRGIVAAFVLLLLVCTFGVNSCGPGAPDSGLQTSTRPSFPRGPDSLHYKCGDPNCGYEFAVKVKDLPEARTFADERDAMKLNCPKCRAEHSCWQETECPNCHKFLVPESLIALYNSLSANGRNRVPENVKDICPHCGTDLRKWWIEHGKKRTPATTRGAPA